MYFDIKSYCGITPVCIIMIFITYLDIFREWIAGRTIIRNIEDSIRHSRKTVLILSDEYLRSHYAGLEMSLAERLRPDEYATYYTSLQMLSGKLLVCMIGQIKCFISS